MNPDFEKRKQDLGYEAPPRSLPTILKKGTPTDE